MPAVSRSAAPVTTRPTVSAVPLRSNTSESFPQRREATPLLRRETNGYDAVCDNCGKETKIAFVPDGVRPVYCKDCLSKKKEEKRLELEERHAAKQKEKELLIEEVAKASATPSLTLDDLKKIAPVDFRGHEIKNRPVPESHAPATPASRPFSPAAPEADIQKDEDVIINNNKF